MTEAPWIRFFPSDWLAGTRGMSAAETGIYITLIATMYERGEPIPEDHARLARLCGASNATFKAALKTLIEEGKITRTDGLLWNNRVGRERSYLAEKSAAGRAAANSRWRKAEQNQDPTDADAMRPQSDRNASHARASRCQIPDAREEVLATLEPRARDAKPTPRDELSAVLDEERAQAVIDHRSRIRKPLTAHAAKLLAGKLAQAPDPNQAADAMIANGWQGFELEWLNGRSRGPPSRRSDGLTGAAAVLAGMFDDERNHEN